MMKLNTNRALMSLVSGTSLLVISLAANAATPAAKPPVAPPVVTKMAAAPKAKAVSAPKATIKAKKHVKHVSAKKATKTAAKPVIKKS